LYGIASVVSMDIDELRFSRDEVEKLLADVLADDPGLHGFLYVEEVPIEISLN
jgi:hypothetical protein